MPRLLRPAATGLTILLLLAAGAAALWWFVVVPEVTVARPTRGPAVMAVYATGTVEPVNWAKVAPLIKGRIVERSPGRRTPTLREDDRAARRSTVAARLQTPTGLSPLPYKNCLALHSACRRGRVDDADLRTRALS